MKKVSFWNVTVAVTWLMALHCGCTATSQDSASVSPKEAASSLLEEARNAMIAADYDRARCLIDSLRATFPREFDARRAAILIADSVELEEAKDSLLMADREECFRTQQLEEAKKHFVFEKQERYQSVGYYVLPQHAGSKANLTSFPEVDETGKLLLVSIDKNRRYSFSEVYLEESDEVILDELTKTSFEGQRAGIDACKRLSACFLMLEKAKRLKEKLTLKIRFYEKKLKEDMKS